MAARRPAVTTIDLSGPFFKSDPVKTFRQNVRVLMDAVAAEGEQDVKAQLRAGNSGRAAIRRIGDHTSDHVIGRTRSLAGKRWALTAVVSVNNSGLSRAQGISLMAAASSVEGRVHAFRKTKNRIGRTRKTNLSELLKGIE
jgi:hypothetical protein